MTAKDREAVFAYRGDKEINQYQGWVPERLEDVDSWLGKRPAEINTPGTWFQLVILDNGHLEVIGDIGLHFPKDENDICWLGCTLRKADHGKGLASECLESVMLFLHDALQKEGVVAYIKEKNFPSRRLFERLGFKNVAVEEGDLYKYFRTLPI
ncbi:MAG: GNAT family N-acetyltransferase [Flavobacteriales bacterium]|nr:GNAT family N-acetyltransferase [Flavobacteriales bacterium]